MIYGLVLASILAAGFRDGVAVDLSHGVVRYRVDRPGWTALSDETIILNHSAAKCQLRHPHCSSITVDLKTGQGVIMTRRACVFRFTVEPSGCVALHGCSLDVFCAQAVPRSPGTS